MVNGPDFSKLTIETLAKRAAQLCSKPDCQVVTSGPHTDVAKAINLGEAAHIRGARDLPNNRYDRDMTDDERSHISNGIWLCRLHAREIDTDGARFSAELLREWKEEHERAVAEGQRGGLAAREVKVKDGGVGSVVHNSGDGVALEIINEGKNPAERITVDGRAALAKSSLIVVRGLLSESSAQAEEPPQKQSSVLPNRLEERWGFQVPWSLRTARVVARI